MRASCRTAAAQPTLRPVFGHEPDIEFRNVPSAMKDTMKKVHDASLMHPTYAPYGLVYFFLCVICQKAIFEEHIC